MIAERAFISPRLTSSAAERIRARSNARGGAISVAPVYLVGSVYVSNLRTMFVDSVSPERVIHPRPTGAATWQRARAAALEPYGASRMKVGLVGLGRMGSAIAQRLTERGCEL